MFSSSTAHHVGQAMVAIGLLVIALAWWLPSRRARKGRWIAFGSLLIELSALRYMLSQHNGVGVLVTSILVLACVFIMIFARKLALEPPSV